MVAPEWLDRDVIACLEEKCGSLVLAVKIAYDSGSVGDELHSFGVRDISGFGPPPNHGADIYIPEGRERFVWARVVEYHGCSRVEDDELAELGDGKKPGRRKGSEVPIPDDTVLEILRLILEDDASARTIAAATDKDPELSFVNRLKAGVIVKWAKKHPVKARRAVDRQEIPEDFPATPAGVHLPKP